jgi:antitoxin component of MazEF toxin-antitoxin module
MATKKPIVAGNSLAVVLDKAVLEATGITRETLLEVSTDGDVVVLSPVRDQARSARLSAIAEGTFTRHAAAFRKLAE